MQQHDNYGTGGDGGSSRAGSVSRFFTNMTQCHTLTVSTPAKLKQQTLVCPMCRTSFKRRQELERHIQSLHLPYWLFCPSPGCRWRGDRVDKLQRHKNTHNGQPTPVEEQECQIYNVKMILSFIRDSAGSDIVTTAQRIAVDLVKERALEIGKQEWLEDPWGRSGRLH